jgi:hypothetical protein
MEDGGSKIEDGGWKMEDGGWRMEEKSPLRVSIGDSAVCKRCPRGQSSY